MRESFVFHMEYIADLPDKYKMDFITYTVNYGLYGENPPVDEDTLEYALWVKIARRIDAESDKYREVSERRRLAARVRWNKTEKPQEETMERNVQTQETESHVCKGAKRFSKPTVEEVAEYCEERKNGLDARAFFDFYESKGWKVGNQHMKDWRACVRTWEQRKKNESTGGRNRQTGSMWGNENEVPQDVLNVFTGG